MLKADRPPAEIAEIVGCREHIVRYTLKEAIESGLLARRTFINVYRLGFFQMLVYFSCKLPKRERKELVSHLIAHPRVSHFAELGGEYDYSMDMCVRSMFEAKSILGELGDRFGNLFGRRSISTAFSITDFPLKTFSEEAKRLPPLSIRDDGTRCEIDELDHRILCRLSRGEGEREQQLAHSLKVPLSTLHFRIKRLKQAGVIAGTRYIPRLSSFGFQTFKCSVILAGDQPGCVRRLTEFCRAQPNVAYCIESLGAKDFTFAAVVESASELSELLNDLRAEFTDEVNEVKLFAVTKLLKSSFFPLEEEHFQTPPKK